MTRGGIGVDDLQIIHSVWPEWNLSEKPLGAGSYGTVYRARRPGGRGEESAIKISKVPKSENELSELRMEGMDDASIASFLKGLVDDMTREIHLMESVRDCHNIVPIDDHEVIHREGDSFWYILIRMPLLTPMDQWQQDHPMGEEEVIRMGMDLCQALIDCRRKNIVHRDIKPENIFINDRKVFMLGDFGVARTLDHLTSGMTRIGSYNYMAPELFNNTIGRTDINHAALVDIYSLGVVMYRLMNHGLLPLLNASSAASAQARQDAVLRRMGGTPLPPPSQASPALAEVILRACAFDPKDRWPSAQAFHDALAKLAGGVGPGDNRHKTGGRKLRNFLIGLDIASFSLAVIVLIIIISMS